MVVFIEDTAMKFIPFIWVLLGYSHGAMGGEEGLPIRAVAGDFVDDLYQNDWLDWFQFTVPPQGTVPDHLTTPRIVVWQTDLFGQRLADGSPINAKQGQALFLTNTFSPGFTNVGEQPATYWVLGFKNTPLGEAQLVQPDGQCLHAELSAWLALTDVVLCQSQAPLSVQIKQSVLFYQASQQQVRWVAEGETIAVQMGDAVLEISARLRSCSETQPETFCDNMKVTD